MNKIFTYGFLLALLLWGCEDIYDPDIDAVQNVIVVDARIVIGQDQNIIELTESLGFNESDASYSSISGAAISLVDNNGTEYALSETTTGNFLVDFDLNSELSYKLKIVYNGNTFESAYEAVPVIPILDSVYGVIETQVTLSAGESDITAASEDRGVMLYADIVSEPDNPYYRFTARKVMEYSYEVEIPQPMPPPLVEPVFAWKSYYPNGSFNVAAPPEYSSSSEIHKHPLYFLDDKGPVQSGELFLGWILILQQYGLSNSAYNYYTDLNSQLESEGRLFDPLYVQARSNIECVTDPDQLILGNFEISTIKERRYYVRYISEDKGFNFFETNNIYDIPLSGADTTYSPDFWVVK